MSNILRKTKSFFLNVVFGVDNDKKIDFETKLDLGEQDSLGAPVEQNSPLGYEVSNLSVFYLIIQGVIGTGIFGTPATIVKNLGSIGAAYVFWVVGFIVTLFQIAVYIEYVTYFRHRSGAEVAYLEQAFPRPQFLVPVVYAAVSVVLSFATSSASAFASYVFAAADITPTKWQSRGMSVLPLFICSAIVATNTKFAMRLNNFIGFVKVVFILFIAISGLVVLGGKTRVGNTHDIFKNAWEGTTTDGNLISNSILKVVFSYGGSGYAFGVVAETRPQNTIKAYKVFVPSTMFFIYVLYILVNTAYFAGIGSLEEIKSSGTLIASVYFSKVFGTKAATKGLSVFVAISAFGHLLGVFIAHSRSLRECGRQGVLPYPRLWTSVKPLGTPLFPIIVTFLVNLVILLAPPPGDAYNFIIDLGTYSTYIFQFILFLGLFKLRRERKKRGLGYKEFHLPTPILIIACLWYLFVLAMAFVPPKGTLKGSDVSFFYATYPITTIGLLLVCVFYYFVWARILPKIGNYAHRIELYELPSGELGHTVIKVSREQLEQWDLENTQDVSQDFEDRESSKSRTSKKSSNIEVTTSF